MTFKPLSLRFYFAQLWHELAQNGLAALNSVVRLNNILGFKLAMVLGLVPSFQSMLFFNVLFHYLSQGNYEKNRYLVTVDISVWHCVIYFSLKFCTYNSHAIVYIYKDIVSTSSSYFTSLFTITLRNHCSFHIHFKRFKIWVWRSTVNVLQHFPSYCGEGFAIS